MNLTYFGKALGRRKEERSPSQYVRTNVRRLMVSQWGRGMYFERFNFDCNSVNVMQRCFGLTPIIVKVAPILKT